tara:strand:- start:55 stop:411 length:357 start_codon:yes stop_codon:yes gene_type:complete
MGATTITDSAIVSKNDGINVAYHDAVKQANWDHGHDSYNGTISTTDGVNEHSMLLAELIQEHGEDGFNRWYDAAFEATHKWEAVWGARVPEHTMTPDQQRVHKENSTAQYIFAGWAAI